MVFAANECKKERESYYFSMAYETGKLLAREGFITVTGGGPGLMNETMRGAFENGGRTIGFCLNVKGREHSTYLSEKRMYYDLRKRQRELMDIGDGFLALPGGLGTIYEVSGVLALKRKGEILPDRPMILIDSIYKNLEKLFDSLQEEGLIGHDLSSLYRMVQNPMQAIKLLKGSFL